MLDVEAVRARYTALDRDARVLRRARRHAVPGRGDRRDRALPARGQREHRRARTRRACARSSWSSARTSPPAASSPAHPDEVAFGPSMTSLNFLLTRALGRTLERGDEIVVHPARSRRQRRALARARRGPRRRRPLRRRARRPLARPRRPRGAALRAHAGRRLPDRLERRRDDARRRASRRARARRRRARLGGRRPLRAARADRRRRLGRRRAPLLAVQVLRPAHGHGVRQARAAREPGARTRCARPPNEPVGHRFEHGTLQHELLAGFVAAVEYIESLGWEAIVARERSSAQRFLDGLPKAVELYGLPTMEGRVPTFAFNLSTAARPRKSRTSSRRGRSPSGTATTTRSRS